MMEAERKDKEGQQGEKVLEGETKGKSQSLFDVGKLSEASRRKYQTYFNLECSMEELPSAITSHF